MAKVTPKRRRCSGTRGVHGAIPDGGWLRTSPSRPLALLAALSFSGLAGGCSSENAKSRFLQAENFWRQGKHEAAVVEFDRIYRKDPKGAIGLQALYRSGVTEALFLQHPSEALRKLSLYVETSSDPLQQYEAARLMGDLLYSNLEQYEQAISHFQKLIGMRPQSPDVAEYLFKIAKSQFFLWRFEDALQIYEEVRRRFPQSRWAVDAEFERGVVLFTQGRERAQQSATGTVKAPCLQAIAEFQGFMTRHPQSPKRIEAEFNIAQCREELDQTEQAYADYLSLLPRYPRPEIVQVKIGRIAERRHQKAASLKADRRSGSR